MTSIPFSNTAIIYEVNTLVWLLELSRKYRTSVTLEKVPAREWDYFASLHVNSVWLMGVWQRSPRAKQISASHPDFQAEFRSILPDLTAEDISGSPYSIRSYAVEPQVGGPEGLACAREELRKRGLKLILDFVPNHVAPDHRWAVDHSDFFVQGSTEDLRNHPDEFDEINGRAVARGRDPYFPPWPDTLQLNAFGPGLREAAAQTLIQIASQCDGVRCDMAMLLLNDIFSRTWGRFAGPQPNTEYWSDVIQAVRVRRPEFLFIAEAYWDLEWNLQQLGFDYCYDKRLYDRLVHGDAESIRSHLLAPIEYQNKLIRFLENHDEPRAAQVFGDVKQRAAAVVMATLHGGKLYHEGQFAANRTKLSVHLCRRPSEPRDQSLFDFYCRLLAASESILNQASHWQLCQAAGWPDNESCRNILAWCWSSADTHFLVATNYSQNASQARLLLPWADLASSTWEFRDLLNSDVFRREGGDMAREGLFIDLGPWRSHVLSAARDIRSST